MMDELHPLEFNGNLFVGRETEIDRVMTLLKKLYQVLENNENFTGHRTIVFSGEHGMGKSWLLSRIEEQVKKREGIKIQTYKIDLKVYRDMDPMKAIKTILTDLAAKVLTISIAQDVTPTEASRIVGEKLKELTESKVFLLLLDHVYESNWSLLGVLEAYLLAPVAVLPHAVIVMAGRGKSYPWNTSELVVEASHLMPFKVDETQRQIRGSVEEAKRISQITQGIPLENYYMSKEPEEKALGQYIIDLLDNVILEDRKEVKEALEVLSILRAFDEERIQTMFSAAFPEEQMKNDMPYGQCRQIKEKLMKNGLASWKPEMRGNVLNDPMRSIVEEYIKRKDFDNWKKLQQTALDLYQRWLEKYSNGKTRWEEEIEYHRHKLASHEAEPESKH
jgi:hypothetical protein